MAQEEEQMSERIGDGERERERARASEREGSEQHTADTRPLSLLHSQRTEAATAAGGADRMEEEDRAVHLQLSSSH